MSKFQERDIVAFKDNAKALLLGNMVIVHILPNNRADVRRSDVEFGRVWQEYTVDLVLVHRTSSGGGF